jgi:hypothetical protein
MVTGSAGSRGQTNCPSRRGHDFRSAGWFSAPSPLVVGLGEIGEQGLAREPHANHELARYRTTAAVECRLEVSSLRAACRGPGEPVPGICHHARAFRRSVTTARSIPATSASGGNAQDHANPPATPAARDRSRFGAAEALGRTARWPPEPPAPVRTAEVAPRAAVAPTEKAVARPMMKWLAKSTGAASSDAASTATAGASGVAALRWGCGFSAGSRGGVTAGRVVSGGVAAGGGGSGGAGGGEGSSMSNISVAGSIDVGGMPCDPGSISPKLT